MKNRNLEHKDDWATPLEFYEKLNEEFNFNFDPCPYQHDMSWDGLEIEWKERNFINPPYSRKLKDAFVKKAIEESQKGKLCVMLLPVSTSTVLFHEYIQPIAKEVRFIKGRIKFCGVNASGEYVTTKTGMHDSMVVVFEGRKEFCNHKDAYSFHNNAPMYCPNCNSYIE
jgi:site-specific DNA-methyltransferase (adenine-specific)